MGTITPTWPRSDVHEDSFSGVGAQYPTWGPMASGDVGAVVERPGARDRAVQVIGTIFNGATLLFEGSHDGTNWSTLHDPQGVLLSFSSPDIRPVEEAVRYCRPRVAGGDASTAITVILGLPRGAH